jgi:hypothetical protein
MYKLGQTSPLTGQPMCILDLKNNLAMPLNPDNKDYQAYLKWVAEGNTPEAAE